MSQYPTFKMPGFFIKCRHQKVWFVWCTNTVKHACVQFINSKWCAADAYPLIREMDIENEEGSKSGLRK